MANIVRDNAHSLHCALANVMDIYVTWVVSSYSRIVFEKGQLGGVMSVTAMAWNKR